MHMQFMNIAIREARKGVAAAHGGPFGCVVVKNGSVVGRGHNKVLLNNDPTCHGEVEAIRDACSRLGTFDLSGCELYTTSEPCPMCKGAIQWANIRKVYQGCNILDAEQIGFRDKEFFENDIEHVEVGRAECLELFAEYVETNPMNY